jgi:hypothetical protein
MILASVCDLQGPVHARYYYFFEFPFFSSRLESLAPPLTFSVRPAFRLLQRRFQEKLFAFSLSHCTPLTLSPRGRATQDAIPRVFRRAITKNKKMGCMGIRHEMRPSSTFFKSTRETRANSDAAELQSINRTKKTARYWWDINYFSFAFFFTQLDCP